MISVGRGVVAVYCLRALLDQCVIMRPGFPPKWIYLTYLAVYLTYLAV